MKLAALEKEKLRSKLHLKKMKIEMKRAGLELGLLTNEENGAPSWEFPKKALDI